jgi:hypothetical protein
MSTHIVGGATSVLPIAEPSIMPIDLDAVRQIMREELKAALSDNAAPTKQEQDWNEIEALRESLREHMAEIHRLRAELADHIGGANEMVTTNLESRPVEPVAWLRAVNEAMVVHDCGVVDPSDDYDTAKRKLNALLSVAPDIGSYWWPRES